jgi:uncharacterized cupredoxin-like copper-binding protein
MRKSRIGFAALVALAALLVWALPAGAKSAKLKVTNVTVLAGAPTEFGYKLSKKKVPAGIVVFKVKNVGSIAHDFKIGGKKTKSLASGKSQTIRVTLTKVGKQNYLCTLPSHAIAGMKGVLTITK